MEKVLNRAMYIKLEYIFVSVKVFERRVSLCMNIEDGQMMGLSIRLVCISREMAARFCLCLLSFL